MFTPVCHSVHSGGAWSGGLPGPGGGVPGPGGGLVETPPRTATAAGGTHPTGMHSCVYLIIKVFRLRIWCLSLP